MAEMAPETAPLAPVTALSEGGQSPESLAQGFPDLYDAATQGRPSFKQIVQAWRLIQQPEYAGDKEAGHWLMPRLRERFAAAHGGLEKEYLCRHVVGGCVLAGDRSVHSILNSTTPSLVSAEIACKVMAREARHGFATRRLKPQLEEATDHAYSALTRVLAAADAQADAAVAEAVRAERIVAAREEVATAQRRVEVLLQRQARYEYFQGVLWGALPTLLVVVVVAVVADRWWRSVLSPPDLAGAVTMATIGAVISVVQRMSTGSLVVDHTASTGQRWVLGSLRPAVGAVFGAVAYFALLTGILASGATTTTGTRPFAFFALAGFAAGFSERFATDMLERAGQLLGESTDAPPAAPPKPS